MPVPTDRTDWTPDPLHAECPSRAVVDLIADKWSILIVATIERGATRNGQLLRSLAPVLAVLCEWAIEHLDDVASACSAAGLRVL